MLRSGGRAGSAAKSRRKVGERTVGDCIGGDLPSSYPGEVMVGSSW